jgi:hypothetical protein
MFGSPFSAILQASYRPSCLHGLSMLHASDSASSHDILNLADVADVFEFYCAECRQ